MSSFVPVATVHNSAENKLPKVLPDDLLAAQFVFVRKDGPARPLDRPYDGPYEVVKRSKAVFQLRIGDRLVNISTARLKPVVSEDLVRPAIPPPHGRPKKKFVTFDGNV
jgi:hypothetical protein